MSEPPAIQTKFKTYLLNEGYSEEEITKAWELACARCKFSGHMEQVTIEVTCRDILRERPQKLETGKEIDRQIRKALPPEELKHYENSPLAKALRGEQEVFEAEVESIDEQITKWSNQKDRIKVQTLRSILDELKQLNNWLQHIFSALESIDNSIQLHPPHE